MLQFTIILVTLPAIMTHASNNIRFFTALAGTFLLLGAIIGVLLIMDTAQATRLLREEGPIEMMTVALYALAGGYWLVKTKATDLKWSWLFLALMAMFALRELDFHTRFTTMGITKTRFYVSPDVPLHEKVFGVAVTVFFIWVLVLLFKRHFFQFFALLWQRSVVGIGVFLTGSLIVVSKSLDGLVRKLAGVGIDLSGSLNFIATTMEEVLEMGIPLLMLLTIWAGLSLQGRVESRAMIGSESCSRDRVSN